MKNSSMTMLIKIITKNLTILQTGWASEVDWQTVSEKYQAFLFSSEEGQIFESLKRPKNQGEFPLFKISVLCEDTNYAPKLVRAEGSKKFQKFKRDNFSKVTHVSFQSLWKNKISFASESFEIWIDRYKMQINPFERPFQKFYFAIRDIRKSQN